MRGPSTIPLVESHVPIPTNIPPPSVSMGIPQSSSRVWNSLNYAPTPVLSVQDYLNHPTVPENQVPVPILGPLNPVQSINGMSDTAQPRGMNEFNVLPDTSDGYDHSALDGLDAEAGKLGGVLMDLIWPGWPPRLPTPGTSYRLIQVRANI